jgi:epoxyqueuosine reductase
VSEELRGELVGQGAAVVGFAALAGYLDGQIAHLDRAVAIGVSRRLTEDTLGILARLQQRAVRHLKTRGWRTLAVPPDSDRRQGTFVSKLYALFNHKMAATSAGIGWVGRSGLLISPLLGPRLTLATVLTDAPLAPDAPVEASGCGACTLCRDHCPSGAITGQEWSRSRPFVELVRLGACRDYQAAGRRTVGKPNCGLCITVCPYGRKMGTALFSAPEAARRAAHARENKAVPIFDRTPQPERGSTPARNHSYFSKERTA